MYEAPPTAPALPAPDQRPPGLGTGCLWSLVSQLVLYLLFVLIPVYISGMYRWSDSDIILWGQFDPLFYEDLTYANGGWRISAGMLLIIISNYLLPVLLLIGMVVLAGQRWHQRSTRVPGDRRVRQLWLLAGMVAALLFTKPLADTFLTWLAD